MSFRNNVQKPGGFREVTDDDTHYNRAQVCRLDNKDHRHKLRISISYCFQWQKLLGGSASMLVYTYIASLVDNIIAHFCARLKRRRRRRRRSNWKRS
jgi:hypothetical protein